VSVANRMALASEKVRAVCVEANEFPQLSAEFGVRGVPHIVVNRQGAFVGSRAERDFVAASLELAGVKLDQPASPDTGETTGLTPAG
jgi:hypothetical protein